MLTLGSYYKKAQGRLAHHRCISLLGAAGFLRREALVAQVKGHLFPYSRYFTLNTESISDEQSQGWQSHIFSTVNSRAPKSIGVRCNSTNHKDRDA